MRGVCEHLRSSLKVHFRNRTALVYGFVFPLMFLAALAAIYRHESVPLVRHFGELLTLGILSGACFGLPTTLVSERERGLWRQFRLSPVPTWMLIAGTIAARYLIMLSAALLQLGAAIALGMTAPAHPLSLWFAFTVASFAFIGLGLVVAALADSVPAVQALGQCLFLPMLILGGVAVPFSSLPDWAQRVAAFFPGRYSVEALQPTINGTGLGGSPFNLLALTLIGLTACSAGGLLFRWDPRERPAAAVQWRWLTVVVTAWLAVGGTAELQRRASLLAKKPDNLRAAVTVPTAEWARLSASDVARLNFDLPPDDGVVAPIESPDHAADYMADQVARVRERITSWPPGTTGDEIQRVRNLLCIAAVPDSIQIPVERYLPLVVLDHLSAVHPRDQLIRILAWIALHPDEGTVVTSLSDFGIRGTAEDPAMVRERTVFYAIKFIARLTGRKTG